MAEEKTEEKSKQTVPALERTAKGVSDHAAAVQERQWDKDRKVFRDPVTAMLALFTYAKLTAALLAEAEERAEKRVAALEKRLAEFETRLTSMERWKAEAEAQTEAMVKGVEDLMASGKMPQVIEQLQALAPPKENGALPAPVVDATITPIKPPPTSEKKGGAA